MKIDREFYRRDARVIARALLGCVLGTRIDGGITRGMIVETEAYLGVDDPASHSARGRTARNSAMFARGGTAYVYLIYGIHYCFNVVTGDEGTGEAVLVRAALPLQGVELMRTRRRRQPRREADLAMGPGRLASAFGIDLRLNHADLTLDERIWIEPGEHIDDEHIVATPRIGISKGVELPWRWVARPPVDSGASARVRPGGSPGRDR